MNLLNEIKGFQDALNDFSTNVIQKDDRILSGLILITSAITLQAQAVAEQTRLMEAIAQNVPGFECADVFPDEREEERA